MATKEAYQQKFAAQLKEWDTKVDALNASVKLASADARIRYENELESMRSQRAAFQGMLSELGRRGENAWADVKLGSEKAWAEMNKAMEQVAAQFK